MKSRLSWPNSITTVNFRSRLSSRLATAAAIQGSDQSVWEGSGLWLGSGVGLVLDLHRQIYTVRFSSPMFCVVVVSLVRTRQVLISICSVLISSSGVSFRFASPVWCHGTTTVHPRQVRVRRSCSSARALSTSCLCLRGRPVREPCRTVVAHGEAPVRGWTVSLYPPAMSRPPPSFSWTSCFPTYRNSDFGYQTCWVPTRPARYTVPGSYLSIPPP